MATKLNTYDALYNNEMDGEILQCNAGFTFIDLLPRTIVPGDFFTTAVYENFRTLVHRANEFLRSNRKWKIVTCESVKFKLSDDKVDPFKTTYIEYGDSYTHYIRGLRLWLTERKDEKEREQQIGYFNLSPHELEKGGIFKSPKLETLDMIIKRFNSQLQQNPLPGRIISIESQAMKISDSKNFDPDNSSWSERGETTKSYIFVIRIFYEVMTDSTEEIGVQDFIPDKISEKRMFSRPEYERFSLVVNKASTWCGQQKDFRFCNAQTLKIKVKLGNLLQNLNQHLNINFKHRGFIGSLTVPKVYSCTFRDKEVDSQRMDFTESGTMITHYVRVLRVAYTKPLSNSYSISEKPSPITELTCRTFVPVQLILDLHKYEDLAITRERISAWVKATGARVLSAETTTYRVMSGGEKKQGSEASFTYNGVKESYTWMFVMRLYIDGIYKEPPPEMLPAVPPLKKLSCSVS